MSHDPDRAEPPVSPRDDGDGREQRIDARGAPCLKRMTSSSGDFGFCQLPAGHERLPDGHPAKSETCGDIRYSYPAPPGAFRPKRR